MQFPTLPFLIGVSILFLGCTSLLSFSAEQPSDQGDLTLGEKVYNEICFSCHGKEGDGRGPSYLNTKPFPQVFANPDYMSRFTDQYMFDVVKYGKLAVLKKTTPSELSKTGIPVAMPAFGDVLTDRQIKGLIQFEKNMAQGVANPWPSEEIKEIFMDACATCHGPEGKGNGDRVVKQPPPKYFVSEIQPPPADYSNSKLMERFSDEYREALIKVGKIDTVDKLGFNTMNPYGEVLSDQEIWSVIKYIRKTFIEEKTKNGR
jgi:mono/diheme cytochrome c family protein